MEAIFYIMLLFFVIGLCFFIIKKAFSKNIKSFDLTIGQMGRIKIHSEFYEQ
nr:MAG TPA: Photosystem II protein D1 [Caudoviricetes sp.]